MITIANCNQLHIYFVETMHYTTSGDTGANSLSVVHFYSRIEIFASTEYYRIVNNELHKEGYKVRYETLYTCMFLVLCKMVIYRSPYSRVDYALI